LYPDKRPKEITVAQPDPATEEPTRLRSTIQAFILDRLQPKLDKLKDDDQETREALIAAHVPAAWIADAARRVGQIQQVTHAIKFTHPSADGSSLSSGGNPVADMLELGSHSLPDAATDVVGNAAALDVFKFLRLEVGGRSLLQRAMARDPALLAALPADATIASTWIEAFAALPEPKGQLASHKLAKQVYWPVEARSYHLLAPLLSSPLAHALYKRISDDRFSDATKAARDARRHGKSHPHGYRDHPDLAIQSFGGSKPQNISQLNSERRGDNYLLASLPPQWESTAIRPPLKTESVFQRYYPGRREVRRLAQVLKEFLRNVSARRSNVHIRHTRATLVAELIDELLNMASDLHASQPPGWTAQPDCRLRLAEQRWLDPQRVQIDPDFAARTPGDAWQDEITHGFANWLNAALATNKTLFSEAEADEWRKALKPEIQLLREALTDD
jgi:CRISPR-associated protein Csy1